MPISHSRKKLRDRALIERWPRRDPAEIRTPVERLKAVQANLQGHIVPPGDADYNKDRLLFILTEAMLSLELGDAWMSAEFSRIKGRPQLGARA